MPRPGRPVLAPIIERRNDGTGELVIQSAVRPRADLRVTAAGHTDVGRVRAMNEDRFALCPDLGLFMAADGMGGHACGEVAAEIALESVEEHLRGTEVAWPECPLDPEGMSSHLASAVLHANRRVREEAAKDLLRYGMGTTFAGLIARSSWACVAHVGDSRVYRVRRGVIEQLTEDHTFSNHVTRTGMEVDPIQLIAWGGSLVRSIGGRGPLEVDVTITPVTEGDMLVICTDGVTNALPDEDLAELLSGEGDVDALAKRLVARAVEEDGRDNATCVLVRWSRDDADDADDLESA